MNEDFLAATSLAKSYGKIQAVVNVSLSINKGEVLGLMGRNGSGKSTLARLLLGFSKPDQGFVRIDGLSPSRFRRERGFGFLPEELGRDLPICARDLLEARVSPDGAAEVVEELQIGDLLDASLRTLSKGQWRKLLMAYALVGQPELVVLDEPDSGLDPLALDCLQTVIRLAADGGAAVIILSHNLEEIRRACTRVGVMHEGKLKLLREVGTMSNADIRDCYREAVT